MANKKLAKIAELALLSPASGEEPVPVRCFVHAGLAVPYRRGRAGQRKRISICSPLAAGRSQSTLPPLEYKWINIKHLQSLSGGEEPFNANFDARVHRAFVLAVPYPRG